MVDASMLVPVLPTLIDSLLQPLSIFVLALGAGFLIPLFYRVHRDAATTVFLLSLIGLVVTISSRPHFAQRMHSATTQQNTLCW